MEYVVLLILASIKLVFCFGSHFPAYENVYDTDVVSDEDSEDFGHVIFKKSIYAHPSYENVVNPDEAQEPCRLSLPTVELSSSTQNTFSGETQDLMEVIPPRIPSSAYNIPFNNWTPYDFEYLTQWPNDDVSYNGVSYNSYNIPYSYPNAVPIRSLPPVSTRILESIPEMPAIDDNLDLNEFSDNYFPPNVRAVRSRDEDILEQLEKDAMMPNILPTMPYPYMRTPGLPVYQSHHGSSGQKGLFSSGVGSNCRLPFLLNCSPDVYRGSMKNIDNNDNFMHSEPAYTW